MTTKNILALITARGGSKGIPKKNLYPLAGKPLIAWTIEAALASPYIDRCIVSSDSEEILQVAREYGAATPFVRPEELSGDLAQQEDAVIHAMKWCEVNDKKYDYILLLSPTSPLRSATEINAAIDALLKNSQAKSIVSVSECQHHPLQSNTLPASLSLKNFIRPELRWKNRQELPVYYQLSGSICMAEWDYFLQEKSFLGDASMAFICSARCALDINYLDDLYLAEIYLKGHGTDSKKKHV